VIEKAKTLAAKEKIGEFKSQQERDQLSAAHESKEHHCRTCAISSIESWKEGFVDEGHVYRKPKTQEIAQNAEETFAQQFLNLMRKKPTICCVDAYSRNQFGSRCHYPTTLCSEQCWLYS
jgi:hypothetical protein